MDWSEPKQKQIWKRFFDAYCSNIPAAWAESVPKAWQTSYHTSRGTFILLWGWLRCPRVLQSYTLQ